MILYNVTIKIDNQLHADWLQWMLEVHIPDVMATGLFLENKVCRLLGEEDMEGPTYAVQYLCESMAHFQTYQQMHAARLQKEHSERYQGHYVAFRTLMQVVAGSSNVSGWN